MAAFLGGGVRGGVEVETDRGGGERLPIRRARKKSPAGNENFVLPFRRTGGSTETSGIDDLSVDTTRKTAI